MADRRPLNPGVVVPKPGGGTQPRDRNNDGRVREKRSDAGTQIIKAAYGRLFSRMIRI